MNLFITVKKLFSCDFECASKAIDSFNCIGLLNESTATATVHRAAISKGTTLNYCIRKVFEQVIITNLYSIFFSDDFTILAEAVQIQTWDKH